MRAHIIRQIDRKKAELRTIEAELREVHEKKLAASSYLKALEDMLEKLPKEVGQAEDSSPRELRHGSDLAKAKDALKLAGHPLHISDLLAAIGKQADKKSRLSLSGSLGALVREKRIFCRPSPNTFGLIEFGVPTDPEDEKGKETVM
jgi:hypothetical protein